MGKLVSEFRPESERPPPLPPAGVMVRDLSSPPLRPAGPCRPSGVPLVCGGHRFCMEWKFLGTTGLKADGRTSGSEHCSKEVEKRHQIEVLSLAPPLKSKTCSRTPPVPVGAPNQVSPPQVSHQPSLCWIHRLDLALGLYSMAPQDGFHPASPDSP